MLSKKNYKKINIRDYKAFKITRGPQGSHSCESVKNILKICKRTIDIPISRLQAHNATPCDSELYDPTYIYVI